VLIVWLCLSAAVYGGSGTSEDIYKLLFNLKPLPKVHYSWGLWYQFEDCEERVLYELARITHSLSIPGEWVTKEQIDKCVYICARVNKTNPAILSSIGINYSPWHRRFGKDLPPTDRGPTYKAELDYFAERINLIKKWVYLSNQKYGTDVRISAFLLDCERFYVKPGDEAWNEGIRGALDAIHLLAQQLVPDARIEWYNRGMTPQGDQWIKTLYFTGKEIMPSLSCSLYRLPDGTDTQLRFVYTCELAKKMNITDVTPWVALASGHKRNIIKKYVWEDNWDFAPNISYRLGKELNSTQPPFDHAKVIVFFPAPFNKGTPAWGKHFVAYVRGATGVEDLSDLGYNK
jgi:hypothetical protein